MFTPPIAPEHVRKPFDCNLCTSPCGYPTRGNRVDVLNPRSPRSGEDIGEQEFAQVILFW